MIEAVGIQDVCRCQEDGGSLTGTVPETVPVPETHQKGAGKAGLEPAASGSKGRRSTIELLACVDRQGSSAGRT